MQIRRPGLARRLSMEPTAEDEEARADGGRRISLPGQYHGNLTTLNFYIPCCRRSIGPLPSCCWPYTGLGKRVVPGLRESRLLTQSGQGWGASSRNQGPLSRASLFMERGPFNLGTDLTTVTSNLAHQARIYFTESARNKKGGPRIQTIYRAT